jgi:hypothetical protein
MNTSSQSRPAGELGRWLGVARRTFHSSAMGHFYRNYTIRGVSRDAVATALAGRSPSLALFVADAL